MHDIPSPKHFLRGGNVRCWFLFLNKRQWCVIMALLARRAHRSEKMMSWIRRQTEMSAGLIQLFF